MDDRGEALKKLAKQWKDEGVTGGPPTYWDLALALAKEDLAGAAEGVDETPAGEPDPSPEAK